VGSWLYKVANLPGLEDVFTILLKSWAYSRSIGHAKLLILDRRYNIRYAL
jgi:hypothetical protein